MKIVIGKQFDFEASHLLPDRECYGKCRNLHGHRYELTIEVAGEINNDGWICNFSELKSIVKEHILNKYDHHHLNDFFETPTAEVVAMSIFQELDQALAQKNYCLNRVTLYETANSYAEIVK